MDLRVDNVLRFAADDCPIEVLFRIQADLTLTNPEYVERVKMERWLGNTPKTIQCFERVNGTIMLPRGYLIDFIHAANDAGITTCVDDRGLLEFAKLDLMASIEPRKYQTVAVARLEGSGQGFFVMPCGSGKTVAGILAIAKLKQPTIILVHTHDLLEQWVGEIEDILKITAARITSGKDEIGNITVATIQTISKRLAGPSGYDLVRRFGFVILDEAHHAPARTFYNVVNQFPAKYRLGLTATPKRDDGLTPMLRFTFGENLMEMGHSELIALGYLQQAIVRPVLTEFRFKYSGPLDHHKCTQMLIADTARNEMILNICRYEAEKNESVLILSNRIDHCKELVDKLNAGGISAMALTAKESKQGRSFALEAFRGGNLQVVAATSLADEGLDMPALSRIVLAFPGRAIGRTIQRLGRIMRPHAGKTPPILYDFVDHHVGPLRRQWEARKKAYDGIAKIVD